LVKVEKLMSYFIEHFQILDIKMIHFYELKTQNNLHIFMILTNIVKILTSDALNNEVGL